MAKRFSLGKEEKLKSRKLVDDLFATGKSLGVFPLRVYYKFLPAAAEEAGVLIGVTVSRKYFRRAVDRNRIKRLLREAYRLQKEELVTMAKEKNTKGLVFFIYVDKVLPAYAAIYESMNKALSALKKRTPQTNENLS